MRRKKKAVEEGKDYSWKKTIMIGPTYQASVPGGLCSCNDNPPYENKNKQLWDPTRLSEEVSKSAETQGANGALGVNGIPAESHIRDDKQALLLLLQCGGLTGKRKKAVPSASVDTMPLCSEEECRAFKTFLRVYKDFHSVQNQKVRSRTVGVVLLVEEDRATRCVCKLLLSGQEQHQALLCRPLHIR